MSDENPYAVPGARLMTQLGSERQSPMFGYGAIIIATLMGSVLGGGLLLAMNFHAMERGRWVLATLVAALLLFAGTMWLAPLLPVGPVRPLILWGVWLTSALAALRVCQASALAARRTAGIRSRPLWLALGLGLLVPVVLMVVSMTVLMLRLGVTLPG